MIQGKHHFPGERMPSAYNGIIFRFHMGEGRGAQLFLFATTACGPDRKKNRTETRNEDFCAQSGGLDPTQDSVPV